MSANEELQAAEERLEEQQTALAQINDEMTDFVADEAGAQRYLAAVSAFRQLIPKATKSTDWVLFGNPDEPEKCQVFLQAYAAQQISQFLETKFGYSISIDPHPSMERVPQTINGVENLTIIYNGFVKITDVKTGRETTAPIMGTASTSDPLFARKHGDVLDPQQVPIGNLMKKALANYTGNGYRTAWGLKGFTLEELKSCGLNINGVHDSKRRSASSGTSDEDKKKQTELWEKILLLVDNKPDLARKWLKKNTTWEAGPTWSASDGFDDISRLRTSTKLYPRLMAIVDKALKNKDSAMDKSDQYKADKENFRTTKYTTYESAIKATENMDSLIGVEKMIAADKKLTSEQQNFLQDLATAQADKF